MTFLFPRSRATAVLCASVVGVTVVPGLASSAMAAPTGKVQNPGFEKVSGGFPSCWTRFTTGKNTGTVKVVNDGRGGRRAVSVNVTQRNSGSKAVVQTAGCALKVQPGRRYDLELSYKSTSGKAAVTLFRQKANGKWVKWHAQPYLPASKKYRLAVARTPIVPKGTKAVRFAMVLEDVGTLVTDNYKFKAASGKARCVGSECTKGHWVVNDFGNGGVRAIHSVMLHNGKVLLIAGSGNGDKRFGRGEFRTWLYNPKNNTFRNIPTPYDMFCAGHVQLPDGRVLVVSGTEEYAQYAGGQETMGWIGSKKSYIFDPRTNRYVKANDLIDGHWYPSATALGNGDVYSVGGYAAQRNAQGGNLISPVAERYSWRQGRWLNANEVAQPNINWATYPSLVLAQDGRLFYNGSSVFGHPVYANGDLRGPGFLDPGTGAWGALPNNGGLRRPEARDMSAGLLLPPAQDQRVMVIGGKNFTTGEYALRYTDVINLKQANPRFQAGPNLPNGQVNAGPVQAPQFAPQPAQAGKTYVSAVILADGTVFETGGSQMARTEHVHEASILDPKNKTAAQMRWKPVAADPVSRTYHNTAVLLDDGRVLAAGSNPDYPAADGDSYFDTRISIYHPPYLYKEGGARPRITAVPKGWSYGSRPVITTDAKITRASLLRPVAVTHSSDPNQRLVNVPVKALGGGRYRLQMDKRPNMAPPGWYMLSVTTGSGVPSPAQWVHVG
ncbi:galactose oxidase early set domain-containing protein [Actinocorallia populi]|uniref:galactose oxidase early set domain-containing protein n=1 Tax=Actinocorallia populi TaxID=2079200 RepID=UPI00130051EE|nr:galactose oxidase early set domain-containing protein [Actinocorallia populi]